MKRAVITCGVIFAALLLLIVLTSRHNSTPSATFINGVENQIIAVWEDAEEYNVSPFDELCSKYTNLKQKECNKITSRPNTYMVNRTSPFNLVVGAPGSGNDWLKWLGTQNVNGCTVYNSKEQTLSNSTQGDTLVSSGCLFVKTHEPWFLSKDDPLTTRAMKVALILRHPIDAAFAEYKRRLVLPYQRKSHKGSLKSSTEGIFLSEFFKNKTFTPNSRWTKYSVDFIRKWLVHATYWLERSNKDILYIIIFKDFAEDTRNQLPRLVEYLNMEPVDTNIEGICCKSMYPFNPSLKRGESEIDEYKELLFQQTPQLLSSAKQAVNRVNKILADKYPGKSYAVR